MHKKIGKNIYLLGLLSLFNDLTSDLIAPLLPAYLLTLGSGAALLGIMEGGANALAFGTVLVSGYYADHLRDSKKMTVWGYRLCSLVRVFMIVPLPFVVVICRWIDRIGKGMRTAPRDRLITSSVEQKEWGKAFGIQRAMDHTGSLVAPLLAMLWIRVWGQNYSTIFFFACIPSLVSVLVIPYFLKRIDFRETDQGASEKELPRLRWSDLHPNLKKYIGVIFVSSLSTPSELFLIMKMEKSGLPPSHAPLVWFVLILFTLGASYIGGLSADRLGRRLTILIGWTLFAGAYSGFAIFSTISVLWVLVAIYGVHMGLIESSERVVAASLVSEHHRGTAMGWYYFAYGLGSLPASLLFGYFWSHVGDRFAFFWNAGLTVVAIILFVVFLNPKQRLHEH